MRRQNNTAVVTAYFGSGHVAERVTCPTCQVPPGAACHSTIHMIGTCVADGMRVIGMHAERVTLGVERWGAPLEPRAIQHRS